MIIIKNFSIFRNKQSDNEKAPTHRISLKVGEQYVDGGALWTKESKNGDKFLSGKLADIFVDHTDNSKSRKSVVMCFEEDLKALFARAGEDYVDEAQIPPKKAPQAPTNNDTAF